MPASRLSRGGGVGVVTSALAPPTPIKNALSPVTLQPYCPVTLQPYCATIRHIRDTGTGAWGQGGLVTLQPPCYTDGMRQQARARTVAEPARRRTMTPLCIDLFAGMFGFSAGWLELGGRVIGFDLEHLPHHGPVPVGAELVLQDVRTLDGAQFKNASLILASPPCQCYSYMAMPWKRAKTMAAEYRDGTRRVAELNALFDACFRIQREACEAAGRHIPMVVENVRGAQPWVGRAAWHYGSFYLWGDVPALMPSTLSVLKRNPDGTNHPQGSWFKVADSKNRGARKNSGGSWFAIGSPGQKETGRKSGAKSARKAASAQIACIPLALSRHIARTFKPASVPVSLPPRYVKGHAVV